MSANKTKWVRLGEYIELCDERNSGDGNHPFSGINKDKEFMPTVADTNNLNRTKYKLVRRGTFVFSGMQTGRDVCIRIAMQDKDEILLVSPAYTTFSIKDTSKLSPHYLYMQFIKFEMDRYGWFLSDGSIRSNLDWERFCDIRIPLPPLSLQRELVNTYNGLKALAEDNERLVAPLTQACEALVVDCKRKYNEVALGDYIELCGERNTGGKYTIDDVRGISTDKKFIPTKANMDGVAVLSYKVVKPSVFTYVADTSRRGDKIALALNTSETSYLISSIYTVFKTCEGVLPEYLYMFLSRTEFDRYSRFNSWGSARETFDWDEMCRVKIPLPPPDVQQSIVNLYHCIEEAKRIAAEAREQMRMLCPALIQKAIHS